MRRSEHLEQREFVSWFRQTFPGVLIHAIPNGGKRGRAEALRLKVEGVVAVRQQDHAGRAVFLQAQEQVDEFIAQGAQVGRAGSDQADGRAAVGDLTIEIVVLHRHLPERWRTFAHYRASRAVGQPSGGHRGGRDVSCEAGRRG